MRTTSIYHKDLLYHKWSISLSEVKYDVTSNLITIKWVLHGLLWIYTYNNTLTEIRSEVDHRNNHTLQYTPILAITRLTTNTHTSFGEGYKRREVTTDKNTNSSKGERQQVDKISTCIGGHCSYFNEWHKMTMENLLTPVVLTIGFILAGTHTTNAQCEFNHTIIHYTLGHWDR